MMEKITRAIENWIYLLLSHPTRKLQKVASHISLSLSLLMGAMVIFGMAYLAPTAMADVPTTQSLANFEQIIVEKDFSDGYWLETFDVNGDAKPDLVATGLAKGDIYWYENPTWKKRRINQLPKPVAMDHIDLDGDGWIDILVSHDYGGCLRYCNPEDGKVSWLRNPGHFDHNEQWTVYPIGDLMSTHRIALGEFRQQGVIELLAVPIVGPKGITKPVSLTLFTPPKDIYRTTGWDRITVDDTNFSLIHEVVVSKFNAKTGLKNDSVLLASLEGISWLYYDQDKTWHKVPLSPGELCQFHETGFKGSGSIAVGKIKDDPYAYLPALEPLHGNKVVVYNKDATAQLASIKWKRTAIETFGEPNENGESSGHVVKTADFDGDGNDEFLAGFRGPKPYQGLFYYKAIDAHQAMFEKTQLTSESVSWIVFEDFDGDKKLDFATIGYRTPGYFLAEDPKIIVFLNRNEQAGSNSSQVSQ
jgi:hypothetical protein